MLKINKIELDLAGIEDPTLVPVLRLEVLINLEKMSLIENTSGTRQALDHMAQTFAEEYIRVRNQDDPV